MNLYDMHRHMYSDTIDNTKIYAEDVNSWIHKSELLYEIRIGIALWAFLTFGEEERTQRRAHDSGWLGSRWMVQSLLLRRATCNLRNLAPAQQGGKVTYHGIARKTQVRKDIPWWSHTHLVEKENPMDIRGSYLWQVQTRFRISRSQIKALGARTALWHICGMTCTLAYLWDDPQQSKLSMQQCCISKNWYMHMQRHENTVNGHTIESWFQRSVWRSRRRRVPPPTRDSWGGEAA